MAKVPEVLDLSAIVADLREASIDPAEVASLLGNAAVENYRRLVEDDPTVKAHLDLDQGTLSLYRDVDGERVPVGMPSGDALRQTANAARKAVAGYLESRDVERTLRSADLHRGELVDGVVESKTGSVYMLRLQNQTWGLLPPEEQAVGEELTRNQHLKVIVIGGRRRARDAVTIVSRTHPLLVQRLLEGEVPELLSGDIVIRAIARDAGVRCKVAVQSNADSIDARGACIGPKGVRHRAVTSDLGSEQLQIVSWSDDPAVLVGNALAPAEAISVTLDEATRTASVVVAADKLSLAIGRRGENARLVAKLTGWRVDISAAP